MRWSARFDDPVLLPNGGKLRTLSDARAYILKLPKAEQEREVWQTAAKALLMAAEERGPMLHASIGVAQALRAGRPEPAPTPRRKATKRYRIIR